MTPLEGHFLTQGYNFSKNGRGFLGDAKALGLVVLDKKIFSCYYEASPSEGIILVNLVGVHYLMQNTKYRGSWPYGFRQDLF